MRSQRGHEGDTSVAQEGDTSVAQEGDTDVAIPVLWLTPALVQEGDAVPALPSEAKRAARAQRRQQHQLHLQLSEGELVAMVGRLDAKLAKLQRKRGCMWRSCSGRCSARSALQGPFSSASNLLHPPTSEALGLLSQLQRVQGAIPQHLRHKRSQFSAQCKPQTGIWGAQCTFLDMLCAVFCNEQYMSAP